MAPCQGVLDLAAPVSVGNGIFFRSFSEQWETKALIFRCPEVSSCSSMLSSHNSVSSVMPVGRGRPIRVPGDLSFLTHTGAKLGIQSTGGSALFLNVLPGRVELFTFRAFRLGT